MYGYHLLIDYVKISVLTSFMNTYYFAYILVPLTTLLYLRFHSGITQRNSLFLFLLVKCQNLIPVFLFQYFNDLFVLALVESYLFSTVFFTYENVLSVFWHNVIKPCNLLFKMFDMRMILLSDQLISTTSF